MENPNERLSCRGILDMHPKSKRIDPDRRFEAARELRRVFSGMYPKVRLIYHRLAATESKAEHVYVFFNSYFTRQQFCRRRNIHNPLRTTYTYNGGHAEVPEYVLQEIEGILNTTGPGAVIFSGPLFDHADHEDPDTDAEGIKALYKMLLSMTSEESEGDTQG
ncbi:unnamed protein product [Rhizoctonia solani]|uniref:Uncharacterized protein n=1 Tax=Rhizoctonia solani TaxID=456999 RepID=A0A8H3HYX4_9AGAM|nr:unnamed protein product [Rhizoctonia solani]